MKSLTRVVTILPPASSTKKPINPHADRLPGTISQWEIDLCTFIFSEVLYSWPSILCSSGIFKKNNYPLVIHFIFMLCKLIFPFLLLKVYIYTYTYNMYIYMYTHMYIKYMSVYVCARARACVPVASLWNVSSVRVAVGSLFLFFIPSV